ncbi:MAG: hypothetical protein HZA19_00210 [Nitrospirae bacterium]|nr:hypothetical protein [Nitrospirota bacterium]
MFNNFLYVRSLVRAVFILPWILGVSLSGTSTAYGAWQAIIGVPEPGFGINETAPERPNPWNATVPDYYYVCPACPGSTDTSNTYGYPAVPRKTIPSSSVSAGSVIEIGGQYDSSATISLQGTQTSPIFIRGIDYASRPKITSEITITGAYIIFENLKSSPYDSADASFRFFIQEGAHHIAIRNCEFEGNLNRAGGVVVGSWGYTGTASASYMLLNNLSIHDLGDMNTTLDQDAHGVGVSGSVDHLWLTNSELARTTGDGIQIEAQQGRRDKIHHIYVGKNISHHHKQTGMWIKHATDVIFSQNTIYGHRASNSSYGQGTGFQYGPDYVWFLFNTIYDNEVGIGVSSNDPPGDGTEAFYIGNLIYNIHASNPTNKYSSGGMTIRGGTNHHIINNTFYDVDAGINVPGAGTLNFFLTNNIIANRSQPLEYDFYAGELSTAVLAGSQLMSNLFYNSSGPRINWGGSTYTNMDTFQAVTGKGQNNLSVDPLFINSATNDFRLQTSSPSKDSGIADDAYTIFFTRYGIDIKKDIEGKPRPMGKGKLWDRGAHELVVPAAPENLR